MKKPYYITVIAKLRKKAGLTQEQLANKTGMSISAVKKYETGKRVPSADVLYRILAVTDNFNSVDLFMDILKNGESKSLFVDSVISKMKDLIGERKLTTEQEIKAVTAIAEMEFLYWEDYQVKIRKYKKIVIENIFARG